MNRLSPIIDPNFHRKKVAQAKLKERLSLAFWIGLCLLPFVALHCVW